MRAKKSLGAAVTTIFTIFTFAASALADIPAPKTEQTGVDWTFVLLGAIFSFISALMFLWIGRKLFKKS